MQQCLRFMHDDAHDQVLTAFNIWDVTASTTGPSIGGIPAFSSLA
jgi:hypothetical protein